ncbi:MAG TPA: TonB-dependent receptor [Gammaproteobacteria bacterium]|nr:TonB-dependent receptor [Gammaproteobacteria bacterium]
MTTPFRARRGALAPVASSLLSSVLALTVQAQEHEALEEIVVTGVLRDSSPVDIAQSVSVVRGDELDRVRAANLGETLANQLGVSSSYFGAGASRPIIRGLAGARVQMLEDGIDSMDAATVSDDHAVTIEPLAADQIEIFRGPTTLLYGSGAIGGVINTVTTRIPTRAPENGFEGAVEVRGDSVADGHGAAVRLDGGAPRFAWHLDAGRRDSDDYEIPGYAHADADPANPDPEDVFGRVENSAAESEAAAFGASWLGANGYVGIGINAFDTLYGIPGHHHEEEPLPGELPEEEELVRIDLDQRRVDLRGGWMGFDGAIEGLNVRVGINDYEHVELEGDAIGTQFTNDATELRLELLHRTAGRWNGAFGVQLGEREFAAVGEEAFVPPVDTSTLGVFVVEQIELEAWQLALGARLESLEHTPSGGLPSFDDAATSVSLGAVRSLGGGYSFVATLSLSDRMPVAEELYSDGPHLATGVVQVGDVSLDKETAQHVDIGIRAQVGEMSWSLTGFDTQYDKFIYLADTGAVDPVDELPIFVYTQADADFQGIEAELFVPFMEEGQSGVDMRLFVDYVKGKLTTGEKLPRLPPLRYGGRLQYHTDRLLVGLEATRYDDQDDIAPFETVTDGYTLVNADFRWRFNVGAGTELELFASAANLGDEVARKHTSFVKDIAPLPGRNYQVGVRSRF